MKRPIGLGAVLLACGAGLMTPVLTLAGATPNGSQPTCEAPDAPGDKREIVCVVPRSERPLTVRLEARFGGSHDDTMASLKARIGAHPVACDAGSKTDTSGEDGEVSLHCAVALTAAGDTPHILTFELSWRHAQYLGFDVDAR